jgi:radical SAM superfamily enzyme YgiQ (UPF0313 family)
MFASSDSRVTSCTIVCNTMYDYSQHFCLHAVLRSALQIARLRSYGCTRLQIGVQHTDDAILTKISREHGLAETITAIRLLKDNCFKVSYSAVVLTYCSA